MSKNRLNQIQSKKQENEKEAREEAKQQLHGEKPWEGEEKTDRVSMRVEPSLKEEFEKKLPRFASISDAIREYMIRVAGEKSDV
jgi:hypothetical protein